MKTVDKDSLAAFEKLLIEIGDVFQVQEDHTIKNLATMQPVTVVDGKKTKVVAFFYEGMPGHEDLAILNPFKETIGINRAREWFYNNMNSLVALILKSLMKKMLQDAVEKKDDNYSQFPLMSRIIDKVDATMLDELEKIRSIDLLSIYYNKKTKTAEAQCCLYDEDYIKEHSKYRKKTWEVFQILVETFLGTDDIPGTYVYTAKLLGIPETDAKLHVIIGLISAMDPWSRDILGMDLHREELEEHLDALEGYAKLYAWVTQTVEKSAPQTSIAPWQRNTPMAYAQNQNNLVPVTAYPSAPAPAMLVPSSSIDQNGNVMMMNSYAPGGSPMVSAASGPLGVPTYPTGSFVL